MAPSGLLALLEAGVAWDFFSVADRAWIAVLGIGFSANLLLLAVGQALHWRKARWLGLVLLGITYVVAHAFVLGVQLLPALAFVALLMAYVQVRTLAERFAPLFLASITDAQGQQFGRAVLRAISRLAAALVVALVVPLFAADLALAGIVPLTTIPSALLLSAALVAVIVLIALLPTFDSRASEGRYALPETHDFSRFPR